MILIRAVRRSEPVCQQTSYTKFSKKNFVRIIKLKKKTVVNTKNFF